MRHRRTMRIDYDYISPYARPYLSQITQLRHSNTLARSRTEQHSYADIEDDTPDAIDIVSQIGTGCALIFEVLKSDGGEYSQEFSPSNALLDDASVYSTAKPQNTNISLAFAGASSGWGGHCPKGLPVTFILSHVLIRNPSSGFTSPLRSAMVFVSKYPISASQTTMFDSFTEKDYSSYMASNPKPSVEDAVHPVCYLTMAPGVTTALHRLDCVRSASYVLIKLIQGEDDNVDIEHIGLYGQVCGPGSFASGSLYYG